MVGLAAMPANSAAESLAVPEPVNDALPPILLELHRCIIAARAAYPDQRLRVAASAFGVECILRMFPPGTNVGGRRLEFYGCPVLYDKALGPGAAAPYFVVSVEEWA